MAVYGIPDNPSLTTSSKVHAWWLRNIRGYQVLRVQHHPKKTWLGNLRMNETYLMLPKHM